MKRVLALAFDGADYDLVRRPTAWSTFVTGLNPGRHGIFNFTTNPNRGTQKLESAASRAGTPIWRLLGALPHAGSAIPTTRAVASTVVANAARMPMTIPSLPTGVPGGKTM